MTTGAGQVITSCAPTATAGNAVLTAQCGVYQPQSTSPSVSDWNFSYDLNVNYKVTPDILAYATYAKSFKKTDVVGELKWLHETETTRRLEGDYIWFKLLAKF